jgi:hypothetical protein
MKYFDPAKKQLIYIGTVATPSFWDDLWMVDCGIENELKRVKKLSLAKSLKDT